MFSLVFSTVFTVFAVFALALAYFRVRMAIVPALLLAVGLSSTGCRHVDPQKLADTRDEVATLTSIALENPFLLPAERAAVARIGTTIDGHILELAK